MAIYLKTVFISFLCCLLSDMAIGQMGDSIKKYYQFKNAAERSILDSDYQAASSNYQKAFIYKHPNLLDAYNAFVVAYQMKDSAQCTSLFKDLVMHGMRKDRLEMLGAFRKSVQEPFYKFISGSYDSLASAEKKGIDKEYVDFLNSIYHRDQDARFLDIPDSVVAADLKNINELKRYIGKNGYPSYWRVGFYEASYEGWIQYFGTIWLLMLHTRHLSKGLNDQLLQAVNTGEMAAGDYATFLDFQNKDQRYHSFFSKETNENGSVELKTPRDIGIINQQRAAIGLDDIETYRRKLEFQRNDNRFFFVPAYMIAFQFSKMDIAQF